MRPPPRVRRLLRGRATQKAPPVTPTPGRPATPPVQDPPGLEGKVPGVPLPGLLKGGRSAHARARRAAWRLPARVAAHFKGLLAGLVGGFLFGLLLSAADQYKNMELAGLLGAGAGVALWWGVAALHMRSWERKRVEAEEGTVEA